MVMTRVWCRLLRVPNLFTVPGDMLAGYIAAGGDWSRPGQLAGGALAVLLLYGAGLLLNDYFDREQDARERPNRPIPSGAIRASTVALAGFLFLAAGVGVAWLGAGTAPALVALLLSGCVVLYDGYVKRFRLVGSLVMGACRGLSIILGATCLVPEPAGWGPAVWSAAGLWLLYIAATTYVAMDETSGRRPGWIALLPAALLTAGTCGSAYLFWTGPGVGWAQAAGAGLLAIAAGRVAWLANKVNDGQLPVPPFIGQLIRHLLLMQAAVMVMGASGWTVVVAVLAAMLAMWQASSRLARWFYAS